ncbi:MAG: Co2+/Mg2+ efflux protein ApaG [Arsenophonus sp.]
MLNQPNICIQTQSFYIENQSLPEKSRFVFSYTISIRNLGRTSVQIISRYWLITNSDGKCTEVQGKGILREKQPTIQPSAEYRYNSGIIIETPIGTMEGHYVIIDNNRKKFDVDIPVFRLAIPIIIN